MANRISRAYRNYIGMRDTRSTIARLRQERFQRMLKDRKHTLERKRYDAASKIQSIFRARRARVSVRIMIVRSVREHEMRGIVHYLTLRIVHNI